MGKHSPCSPSSMHRRVLCPRSMQMEAKQPAQTSADAERGTDLHAVTMKILLGQAGLEILDTLPEWEAYLVDRCVSTIREIMEQNPDYELHCEHPVDMTWLHPSIGKGTADVVLVAPFAGAVVADFKFGQHRVPPAKENYQLALYGAGVRREFDLLSDDVHLMIIQPGAWFTDEAVLADCSHLVEQAHDAAAAASNPDAPLVPGVEQCRYCRALAVCPAVAEHLKTLEELSEKKPVDALRDDQLAEILEYAELAESYIASVRQRSFAILSAGGNIPGWSLQPGRASYQWTEGAREKLEQVAAKLQRDPKTLLTEPELKSVAELKKSWGRSKAVLAEIEPLIKKSTKLKLTKGGKEDGKE